MTVSCALAHQVWTRIINYELIFLTFLKGRHSRHCLVQSTPRFSFLLLWTSSKMMNNMVFASKESIVAYYFNQVHLIRPIFVKCCPALFALFLRCHNFDLFSKENVKQHIIMILKSGASRVFALFDLASSPIARSPCARVFISLLSTYCVI